MYVSVTQIVLIYASLSAQALSFHCQHELFILDYTKLYSLSQVAIIINAEDINLVQPMMHLSVAYITYEHSDIGQAVEYIISARDEIEALFFIGTDHSNLIHRLDNDTDVFHSEIISVMESDPNLKFSLRLDTNVVIYKHVEGTSYTLTEDYAIRGGQKISMEVGYWSKEHGLNVSHPLLWERRSNLKNVELTNTIMPWPRLNNYTFNDKGDIVLLGGIYQEMMSVLQKRLNFSTQTITSPDNKWGKLLPNGTWIGLIKQLEHEKADMSSAGLTRSFERDKVVSFGLTMMEYLTTLIQPSDTKLSINIWFYVAVFPPLAWTVILSLMLTVGMFLLASTKCYTDWPNSGTFTFIDSLSITFLYLVQLSDGNDQKLLRSKALKIGLVTWALGSYLVFAYYSAALIADMTTGPPESTIR